MMTAPKRSCFLLPASCFLLIIAASDWALAVDCIPTKISTHNYDIRVNGQNVRARVPLAGAERSDGYSSCGYGGSGPFCPDGHKTTLNRHFAHMHVNHSLPKMGTYEVGGNVINIEVTSALVNSYYETAKFPPPNWTPVGDQDSSMNCHGHSTGYGTFIDPSGNGMGAIKFDDYMLTGPADATLICNADYEHSGLIQTIQCGSGSQLNWKIKFAKEKWNESKIYKWDGTCAVPAVPKVPQPYFAAKKKP